MKTTRISGATLAKHFACSAPYVSKMTAAGIIDRGPDGRFDRDESIRRYIAHLRLRAAKREPVVLENLLLSDADLAMLQRDFDQQQERKRRQQPETTRSTSSMRS